MKDLKNFKVDVELINSKVMFLMTPFLNSFDGKIQIPGIEIYPVWKWRIVNKKLIPELYYKSTDSSL